MTVGRILWRDAENDVERHGKLSNARILNRLEFCQQQLPGFLVSRTSVNPIALVLFVALDQHLRGVDALAILADREVNVRRAAGVGNRLDGSEIIDPAGIGEEPPVALEIRVAFPLVVRVPTVQVDAMVIHLPDLHHRIPDRTSVGRQNSAAQVGDFSQCRSDRVIEDDQVIVCIQRHLVRVERTFRHLGRGSQFFSEDSTVQEQGCTREAESTDEVSAAGVKKRIVGGDDFHAEVRDKPRHVSAGSVKER